MSTRAEGTKRQIIEAAYDLFYKGGFAAASVDAIAEAAGVTKRTLYYHFDSKDALLGTVLDHQHTMMFERIQRWAQPASGDPARMVEILFTEIAKWANERGWQGSGFTRAAVELAHLPGHPARAAARRHKAGVENWLAERFAEHGLGAAQDLARQVMLLIEGCLSLILIHGDATYTDAASRAGQHLVERCSLSER